MSTNQATVLNPARAILIFWDGECAFCHRAVTWLLAHDKRGRMQAIPYQDAVWPPMTAALYAACPHAVHAVTPEGRVLRAGRACLYLLERVGWGLVAQVLMLPPFIWFVEMGYKIVAANRNFFSLFFFRGKGPDGASCTIEKRP